MDPDATLTEIKQLVDEVLNADEWELQAEMADALAERVEALDNWIRRGGYLPAAWIVPVKD